MATTLDAGCAVKNIREASAPSRLPLVDAAEPHVLTSSESSEMMMAHDSSPPPAAGLAEETIARTRVALSHYLDDPEGGGQELREALDAMATEARSKSMLPEQLLVVLKDVWYALPAVRSLEDSGAQIKLLQRVVTMCIKEYYR
jgi:hypothetical protein